MARRWGCVVRLIVDILFPRACVRCGREGSDVCPSCWSVASGVCVSLVCPSCHKLSSIGSLHAGCSSSLDGLIFSMPYVDGVTHGLLRRWKFDYVRSVEPHLKRLIERMPLAEILPGDDWLVVPVPLHERRKRERGFDQAAWIAKTVADLLHLPAANALERTRYTKQQSLQPARRTKSVNVSRSGHSPERFSARTNVHSDGCRAGGLDGAFRARMPIEGRVILCDDVFTSGATMEAAAEACRDAGATSVWGVTIAKG